MQSTKAENRGSAADLPSDRARGSYRHILRGGGRYYGQSFVCLVVR
jgi:hypothetical protein